MISKKFFRSSLIYTIGGALSLLSTVIMLPFYTNLLTTSDFGALMLFISFSLFAQIITNFSLDTFIGVHYVEYSGQKEKLKEYIGTITVGLIIIGVVLSLLFLAVGHLLFEKVIQIKGYGFYPFGLMSVATAIFNSYFRTYSNLLINQQKPERFFWVNIFNFAITIVISLIGLHLYPYSLTGPMWGRFLSGVMIFLLAYYMLRKEFGMRFSRNLLREIYDFCLPITLFSLITWCFSYLDRFIINHFMPVSEVGIYDFAVKFTLIIEFVQNGLATAITPKIFSIWKADRENQNYKIINRYYNAFTAISLLLVPVVVILIPIVIPFIVSKKDFYRSFDYLPLISLGFVFRVLFFLFINPIYYFKKTRVLPRIFFLSTVLQIGLSIVLIKYFGLPGAVWACLIGKPLQTFLLFLETRKIIELNFNKMKLLGLPLIFSVFFIALELAVPRNYSLWAHILDLVIAIVLVIAVYKNELRELLAQLLSKVSFFRKNKIVPPAN